METKPRRVALLGVGPMAVQHLKAIRAGPGLDLAVSVSRDPGKARAFAAEHGIGEARGLADFVASPGVEGVYVVVPAESMHVVAIELSKLGLPLFFEKPVGLSQGETRMARDRVTAPHMVGVNRRFYEVMRRGKRLVEERGGAMGIEIQMPEHIKPLEARYGRHVLDAWMYGNSIHLIDLFRYFGGEVDKVEAMRRKRSWHDRSVVSALSFASGALGVFHAHWGAPGGWRVCVSAPDLQIVYQPVEKALVLERGKDPVEWLPEGPDKTLKAGLRGEAEAFETLIRTGTLVPPAVDLADYARSVDLVAAIFGEETS